MCRKKHFQFCRLTLCPKEDVLCPIEDFQFHGICSLTVGISAHAKNALYWKSIACQWVQGYPLLSLLSGKVYLALCWGGYRTNFCAGW